MPTQITALSVSKSFDGNPVLADVTCSLDVGERTGIIGENGSGKTTLLRLFAGRVQPDSGEIVVQADGGVGYLAQDEQLPQHLTVQQLIDQALRELRVVEAKMRRIEAAMADGDESGIDEYGELTILFEHHGGYDADARVEQAFHGLGLGLVDRDRVIGELSGGEQVRLRLATVLAAAPELLLLDEPTNHLDDVALTWLEDHLLARRGTTVAVSHDRAFLEKVTTSLLEVDADRRRVVRYNDGYPGFLAEKKAERARWVQAHAQWLADTDRYREAADTTARRVAPGRGMSDNNKMAYSRAGGRVQQSVASRVRNAQERLRRLLADPVPAPPQPLRFAPTLATAGAQGTMVEATDISVAGRLEPTSLKLSAGDRLLITGPNGAGKTTLLRALAGELTPDTGTVTRTGTIGYLAQEPPPAVRGRMMFVAFARDRVGDPEFHGEQLRSLGLFDVSQFTTRVEDLSTGQRQRLALARLVTEPVDVLLLDEPTNHLSPALVEELETALAHFPGAIVVVSHDRRLRSRWEGSHLALQASASV
ncbi:ABC-F family ATP-binding cassette domain-containing protein [Nocardia sp. NPDC058666]|uniref:ABC-F family ATP-binding cassette domain-containing protein n=1 Tax=Nocardia sp. NPDC058666 TaxID=3346587 RepID=UPI0036544ECB